MAGGARDPGLEVERLSGLAGKAVLEGRLGDATDALRGAFQAARRDGDPRAARIAGMLARVLTWQGRADLALDALDEVPEADVLASPDLLGIRAEIRAAVGRFAEALSDWAALPADRSAAALEGRAFAAVAEGGAQAGVELLESLLADRAAAGDADRALRLRTSLGALYLELGRRDDARAAWEAVARKAPAAGAVGLGLQARAFLARHFATTDDARGAATADLALARGEAVNAGDPLAYVVVSTVLAEVLADAGRDAEAADAAFRVRAGLGDLLGEGGTRLGDGIVRALSLRMGAGRWDAALDAFIEARKAGREVGDA